MASRPYRDISFSVYAPDFAGTPNAESPGYLVDVTGCRPVPNGLKSIPLFTNISGSTTVPAGTAYGRIHAVQVGATVSVFACTATFGPTDTHIYQTNDFGVNWYDVEGGSGAPGLWADFCQFGNLIIATSLARVPQAKDLTDPVADNFADLGGSPPTGASIARVRDHVVIGNLSTDAYAVRWSAINDPEDWPTPGTTDALSKESGQQSLPIELGKITKVVGGEKFGLIFQQRGITRMTYVGGSVVYEFDTFERNNGTGYIENAAADSVLIVHPVVNAGGRFVWVNSTSGLYMTDGYSVRKVSLGKFDSLFSGGASNYSAAYDDRTNTVLMIYAGNSSKYFLYNPDTDQMGLETDSSIRSVCSCPLLSGEQGLLNISSSLILQQQTSSTQQTLSVQTGYIELDPGYRVQLQGAQILGPGTSALTLSYKTASSIALCDTGQGGFTTMTAAPLGEKRTARDSAQYIAFRITGAPLAAVPMLLRGIRVYAERMEPAP
jgi:hypothetical protein